MMLPWSLSTALPARALARSTSAHLCGAGRVSPANEPLALRLRRKPRARAWTAVLCVRAESARMGTLRTLVCDQACE